MTIVQKELDRKRADAIIRIGQTVVGTTLAGAVPTPALETAKMLGIAAADAWMFWDIYKIYYHRNLSAHDLREMLGRAGVVIFTGGVVGYAAVKVSQAVLSEVLNVVPVLGWGISGVLTGTSTLAVGLAWMLYVEDRYRAQWTPIPIVHDSDEAEPPRREYASSVNGHHSRPASESEPGATEPAAAGDADKIETLHPEGKRRVSIDRHKYEQIRAAILDVMQGEGEIGFKELSAAVSQRLPDFEGSVTWYVTTVKLDLEARGLIERVEGANPQRLRIREA